MSDNNPYSAPESDVIIPPTEHVGGSVERALAGEVTWRIGDVLSEAWDKVNGFKLTYFLALLIYMGISIGLGAVFAFIKSDSVVFVIVQQLVTGIVTYPLGVGMLMMGIKRAVNLPVEPTTILGYYDKIIPIFLLYLLMMLCVSLGLILLIIPGIYLMVAYGLAMPLMVEKNMGLWEALETSRKSITKCWFQFLGLGLLIGIIVVISMIPLGIGLIWTMPMAATAMGIVYREMFGVNA